MHTYGVSCPTRTKNLEWYLLFSVRSSVNLQRNQLLKVCGSFFFKQTFTEWSLIKLDKNPWWPWTYMLLTKTQTIIIYLFSFQTNWKKFLVQDLPTQCGVFFTMNQFVSFLSFRSFSTGQICQRWHKDKVANRHCYR